MRRRCVRFGCHILTLVRQHTRSRFESARSLICRGGGVSGFACVCRNRVRPRNYSLSFATSSSSYCAPARGALLIQRRFTTAKNGAEMNNLCAGRRTVMHQNSCLRFLIYERRRRAARKLLTGQVQIKILRPARGPTRPFRACQI
jgi:hypothetical protein